MTISVLLVDDHVIFREGLRAILEVGRGIQILGEANNGLEALDLCERFKPDVVVLDWVMPGMGGLEVIKRLVIQHPETHIIILSLHADQAYVHSALQCGACGYILKEDVMAHLVKAIYAAAVGQRYFSPILEKKVSV